MKTILHRSGPVLKNSALILAVASTFFAYADISDTSSLVGAIRLGKLVMAGTGCPKGSVQTIVSRDGRQIELVFEEFAAQAGGNRSLDRKNCSLALPIRVPRGFAVSTPSMRLEGFAYVPQGAKGTLNFESFFAGSRSPQLSKSFEGPLVGGFIVNTASRETLRWSPCGDDVTLRINMSVNLNNPSRSDEAVIGLVAAQGRRSGFVMDIQYKACN